MKKPKKITVKFFLNKSLKEIIVQGEKYLPLYAQITYDRKNTQIRCSYGGFFRDLHQVNEKHPRLLSFEESIFKRSVENELKKWGDGFKLKGLGKVYESYSLSIHLLFNNYLKLSLKNLLQEAKPDKYLEVLHLEKTETDFFTVLEVCQKIFDNLEDIMDDKIKQEIELYKDYLAMYKVELEKPSYLFPIVIDWLDGSHPIALSKRLAKQYKDDIEKIRQINILIHHIVTTKVELG